MVTFLLKNIYNFIIPSKILSNQKEFSVIIYKQTLQQIKK